jgi:acyl-CoA thioesterase FadM
MEDAKMLEEETLETTNGGEISVAGMHTRYFRPEHYDGAPYFVALEIERMGRSRSLDGYVIHLSPEEAIKVGHALITRGYEAQSLNVSPIKHGDVASPENHSP